MKRSRTLGIAVAMALALTALVGVAQASANNFKMAVGPETLTGKLAGAQHSLFLGGTNPPFYCKNVNFSGETKVKSIGEITVSPELGKCEHINGAPDSWAMRGCKFRFKAGPGPALVGSVDIVGCEPSMLYANTSCQTTIGNQSGLGTVEYKNTTVGGVPAITVIAKLTGVTYTRENTGACLEGPTGTFSDGTYNGEWTVTGATSGGFPAGVEIESTTAPPPTKFAVEEVPATLVGASTSNRAFGIGENGTFYCESTTYSGTSSTLTAASLVLTPKYKECKVSILGHEYIAVPDINPGGCRYEFALNGTFSIVGTSCASEPIKISGPSCVITIGPQTSPSTNILLYSNSGSGKTRSVSMTRTGGLVGLTYTATGSGCTKPGSFSNGNYMGSANFTAKNSAGLAQGLWLE